MSRQYKNHFALTLRLAGSQYLIINKSQLLQFDRLPDCLTDLTLTDDVETDEESHHGAQHGGDAEDEDALGQGPVQHHVTLRQGEVSGAGAVHLGSRSV